MTAVSLSLVPNRRKSAREAMMASLSVRQSAGLDLRSPICVFDLCESMGVTVRFNDLPSLEGMYERGRPARIHLSSLRPMGRRRFNCAHELGHHVFRHGTTIHELRHHHHRDRVYAPDEFLANTFAAFLLLPALGVGEAFAARGIAVEDASAQQVFAVSCDFGVGYTTLVTHLVKSLGELSPKRGNELLRYSPKTLRMGLLGEPCNTPVVVLDRMSLSTSTDVEVESRILLPKGTSILGDQLEHVRDIMDHSIFEATKPGIVRALRPNPLAPLFIRVSKRNFVGLARYRHLGPLDEDE